MASLCNGKCCEEFEIFGDISELDKFTQDMLIPIEGKENFYTCKYWDSETTLCTVYEQRPKMCREFPYPWPPNPAVGRDIRGCQFCGEVASELSRELS